MPNVNVPELSSYLARDGESLYYRYYPSTNASKIVILLHGIAEDSKYLAPLANFIAENNLANVYTPDLRGYGESPPRRGDIDYIGQLEDDLADLLQIIRESRTVTTTILAGHSAGGGTAIRFAESKHAHMVDKYLLLAPFVHFLAPIMKKPDEGNSNVQKGRLIGLYTLNKFGYTKKNHLPVITRNKPLEKRHGAETLTLSYRLFVSRVPTNYKKALAKLPADTLLMIGDKDEEFEHTAYDPLFKRFSKTTTTKLLPETNHEEILSNNEVFEIVKRWL